MPSEALTAEAADALALGDTHAGLDRNRGVFAAADLTQRQIPVLCPRQTP